MKLFGLFGLIGFWGDFRTDGCCGVNGACFLPSFVFLSGVIGYCARSCDGRRGECVGESEDGGSIFL